MTTSYNKGIAKGIAEGKDEANRENARRMKADGMTFELISKYTGLSKEEIEAL
jgi:predicted transposase/invertase (TIGR01784 family)